MIKKNAYIKMLITIVLVVITIIFLCTNIFGLGVSFSIYITIGKTEIGIVTIFSLISFLILLVVMFLYVLFIGTKFKLEVFEKDVIRITNIYDYALVIISAIMVVYFAFVFVGFPVTVEQSSMTPNYVAGEHLLVFSSNNDVLYGKLKREDVVVFKIDSSKLAISSAYDDRLWIKRVIGLPGEKINFVDGVLYVNNVAYNESYLFDEFGNFKTGVGYDCEFSFYNHTCQSLNDVLALTGLTGDTIPEGYYLLLGDNRAYSYDSWSIGLIPEELIVGKATFIINNLFDWKKI